MTLNVFIIDTENPLTPSDPFSTGVGLIGISEAVEPEAESSHDSVDVVSGTS